MRQPLRPVPLLGVAGAVLLPAIGDAPATSAVDEEFLAVLGADERWIRDEFEAIIAACWVEPPARVPHHRPPPAPGVPPHRAEGRPAHTRPGVSPRGPEGIWARERSPPGRAATRVPRKGR
jgi:hypothetical protein